MRFLVLGGGVQGLVIAKNLASRKETDEVVVGDVRAVRGRHPGKVVPLRVDATKSRDVARAARGVDVAVTSVPGEIGHRALANLVKAGIPTVDIAFMPEAPFDLAKAARESGAPVIVDCGVAPGLSHVLAMALHRDLRGLDDLRIYVGGIPLKPPPVFRHAVYFNARDLLSEYVRPARMRDRRKTKRPHPLDHPVQRLRDGEAGDLEAFLSDGLRSLLGSLPDVPSMSEWTLRVPGHLEFMRMLRALGFLDGDKETDGAARVLNGQFPGANHPDRLLMEVWGRKGSRTKRYRLHDVRKGGATAMARTTGFTAASAAVLLARGLFTEPGIHAPERLGESPSTAAAMQDDLAAHGLRVTTKGRLRLRS